MTEKKIIVVANPDLIPGGLETVRKALAHYLKDDEYVLAARVVAKPYVLTPSKVGPIVCALDRMAAAAEKTDAAQKPSLTLAYLHGRRRILRGENHIHAVAKYKGGSCGRGQTGNRPRNADPALGFFAYEMLTQVMRYHFSQNS